MSTPSHGFTGFLAAPLPARNGGSPVVEVSVHDTSGELQSNVVSATLLGRRGFTFLPRLPLRRFSVFCFRRFSRSS